MAQYVGGFVGLNATNARIDALKADFSGLDKLERVVDKVLQRLAASSRTQHYVNQVKSGSLRMGEFDYWFADEVRRELGKTLAIVRAKAKQKAASAGAGSAASGVLWHQAREGNRGYVGITSPRGRISNRRRIISYSDFWSLAQMCALQNHRVQQVSAQNQRMEQEETSDHVHSSTPSARTWNRQHSNLEKHW